MHQASLLYLFSVFFLLTGYKEPLIRKFSLAIMHHFLSSDYSNLRSKGPVSLTLKCSSICSRCCNAFE
ncbi:hypothetical protein AAZX31_09G244700 [Glycine max]